MLCFMEKSTMQNDFDVGGLLAVLGFLLVNYILMWIFC